MQAKQKEGQRTVEPTFFGSSSREFSNRPAARCGPMHCFKDTCRSPHHSRALVAQMYANPSWPETFAWFQYLWAEYLEDFIESWHLSSITPTRPMISAYSLTEPWTLTTWLWIWRRMQQSRSEDKYQQDQDSLRINDQNGAVQHIYLGSVISADNGPKFYVTRRIKCGNADTFTTTLSWGWNANQKT